MNKNNTFWAVVLILLILVSTLAIRKNSENHQNTAFVGEPITIGHIAALSGLGASQGEQEKRAVDLAVKEINAGGGINGRELRVASEDLSLDKLKNAGSVATKLISADKVVAVVGTTWDEPAIATMPIFAKAQIPMVGPNQTKLVEGKSGEPYFFSTWYDNEVGIENLLAYAQSKKWDRVVILKPLPIGFYELISRDVKKHASEYGISVIGEENANDVMLSDIRTTLSKIKSQKPNAVLVVMSGGTECSYLKQAREIGLNVPVITTESARDTYTLSQCAELMNNVFISYPKISSSYGTFENKYVGEYGKKPETPSVMTAYDAVMILAEALKKTNGDGGEKLRMQLSQTKNFKGVSQDNITFDDAGFVITPKDSFEMQTVKDGGYVRAD